MPRKGGSRSKLRAWQSRSHRYLLKNRYISVREDMVLRPDGQVLPYFTVERTDFAVIVPVLPNGNIVMVRQFRYPLKRYTWEFPMGIVHGATMLQAAKTELIQETGFRAKKWKKLGTYNVAAGMMGQRAHIYLATGLIPGTPEPEEGEFLECSPINPRQIDRWVRSRQLQDGPSLTAWLYYKSA